MKKEKDKSTIAKSEKTEEQSASEELVFRKFPKDYHNSTKVSFIESSENTSAKTVDIAQNFSREDKKEEPVTYETMPRIRRMSDSTRAREAEKIKKKGKAAKLPEENYTYAKERPDGEYAYTQIHDAKKYKKRKKFSRQTDVTAVATETLHLDLKDIISVAVPMPEDVKPVDVKPAPRAQKTSLDLSAANHHEADALDVTIRRTEEEAAEETRRRQEISDRMKLENTADIRSDIAELRSSIMFRLIGLMLAVVVSCYLSLRYAFGLDWLNSIPENFIALMQLLLGCAAGSVCLPTLKNGLTRLFQFRADTDTLAAVALLSCMLDSLFGVCNGSSSMLAHHFMPCAIFVLLMHTMGKLLIIDREETNLKVAAGRYDCYGMQIVEDEQKAEALARGVLNDFPVLASIRKTDSLKDFRKYTYSADLGDYFCRYAAPACCIFSLAASLVLAILKGGGISYAVGLFSMFSVACGCVAITFVVNLPLFKATRRLSRTGALLLGYQSVDDFYDTNALMLDAASLFPVGSVKLQGIKMYSNVKTEESLLAAASLARYAGSAFSHLFDDILQGKHLQFYSVENYVYEDSLGLCGWIQNQRVLFGTRELMMNHHIEGIPAKTKEEELAGEGREVLYLSISGNLSALFVIELQADNAVKFWIGQAMRHNICLLLHSVDPVITLDKISDLFEIPQEMIKIIPARMQEEYASETSHVKEMCASMACANSFSNVMQLITSAKVIRNASLTGIILQALSVLLGLALVLMESLLHVGMTPAWIMIMQCITVLMTVLCVNIRRVF